jgi:hypothetical protein
MGEKWPRNFAGSGDFHHHFWVLLRAVKHDMGQQALQFMLETVISLNETIL